MNIILASASPRRRQILRRLGYRVRVMVPGIDENIYKDRSPSRLAVRLASAKAGKVAKEVRNSIIIGADTVVLCGRELVGKPENYKDSKRILKKLSGSKHKVITGYTVIDQLNNKIYRGYDQSVVHFREIPESEIGKLAGKHMDKAGAYAVQSKKDRFALKVEGSFDNVVGLPSEKISGIIEKIRQRRQNA